MKEATGCGRYSVPLHKAVRETFAAFKPSSGGAWSDHSHARFCEAVGETGHERDLGAYDDEVYRVLLGKGHQAV